MRRLRNPDQPLESTASSSLSVDVEPRIDGGRIFRHPLGSCRPAFLLPDNGSVPRIIREKNITANDICQHRQNQNKLNGWDQSSSNLTAVKKV